MEVPRTLWHTNVYYLNQPGEGHICEAGDVEAAVLMAPAGLVLSDEDAKRLGITEYLETHQAPAAPVAEPETKAVDQVEVEDKAVTGPDVEVKAEEVPAEPVDADDSKTGASMPPETRRTSGGRRG